MIQERIDDLREWFVERHQAKAQHHVRRRDHWRWQIERPWLEVIPHWAPWAVLAAFWAMMFWVLR